MLFKIGDLVTRKSYKNDVFFKIIDIVNDTVYLKGIDIRLLAVSNINDLEKSDYKKESDEDEIRCMVKEFNLDRSEYFYFPGKILHIDGDKDYLNRCMKFYKEFKIMAYGITIKESNISQNIISYLKKVNPDIVVITGHDAYFKNKNNNIKLGTYKNSNNFINAIKRARKFEKSQEKLIIIAGACQSNYEELIKAGANFASSPKRINIHALDPAIIASFIALSSKNKTIDIMKILSSTKYKEEGMGGIITNGTMYMGYPR